MSEIQRYEPNIYESGEMDVALSGDYVLYTDYAAALAAKDAEISGLRARVAQMGESRR